MPKIIPNLWFDDQAEEAAEYYCSIFTNSQVKEVAHYTEAGPGEPGTVLTLEFYLDGQPFVAINGGPHEQFNDAISLQVLCDDQDEIDYYWDRLTAGGGTEVQCGWLKDKFGVSWQVVPSELGELIADPDRARADRVVRAMLAMKKIDIEALYVAAAGGGSSEKKSSGGLAGAVKNVAKKLTGGGNGGSGGKGAASRKEQADKTSLEDAEPETVPSHSTSMAKKPAEREAAAKRTGSTVSSSTKTPAKKTAAPSSPAKAPAAKKTAAKKAPATKSTAKKSSGSKSPATKSPAKKTAAKKSGR